MIRSSNRPGRTHNRDRRAGGALGPALEALEGRQLLATHVLADFFPLSAGAQWNFSGTLNGLPATATINDAAGGTIGGFATTRERTVITPNGGGTPTIDAMFLAHTSTGLRLLRENVQTPAIVESTLFGAGLRLFTVQVDDDSSVHFTKSLTGTSADGRSWTGSFVGNSVITGLENIQTSAGSFEALRVMMTGTLTENGSTGWTATGTISETRWLVKGVGPVRIDYSSAIAYSDIGDQAFRYDLGLTSSNRLIGATSTTVEGLGVVIAFGDTSPGAPDGTNYTGIDVNGGTKTRVFTITNTTNHAITLAPGSQGFITISGDNASDFTAVRQPAQTIQPGQTTPFSVRFDPSATGFRFAAISFQTTDTSAAPFTFDIRGTGILLGLIQVLGPLGVAITNGAASPSAQTGTAFGSAIATGTPHIQRIFTIVNTGPGALALTGATRVVITGADAGDFTVTLQPSISPIQPGQSAVFKVSFDPSAGGATAVVSIATNDRLNPLFTFTVGGVGV